MGLLYLLAMLLISPTVAPLHTTVGRSSGGDTFGPPSNSCLAHRAHCHHFIEEIFGRCHTCQCKERATYYAGMCRDNFPQDQLNCELFLEKDEYYGLVTRSLSSRTTHLGFIKYKWYWDRQVFSQCSIDDTATYWNTRQWTSLFTEGRLMSDFHFENDNDGVRMEMTFHHHDDKRHLYSGLLIKLSVTCYSPYPIPRSHVDTVISKRWYANGYYVLNSCLIIKFAGQRTYYFDKEDAPLTSSPKTVSPPTTLKSTSNGQGNVSAASLYPTVAKKVSEKVSAKTDTVIGISSTPIKSTPLPGTKGISQPSKDAAHHDGSKDTITSGSSTIYVILIVLFVALSSASTFYCYRYRSKYDKLVNRSRLTESYGSTDSSSHPRNKACDVAGTPMYPDVKELENWTKFSQAPRSNLNENHRYFPNVMTINGSLLPRHDSDDDLASSCRTYEPYGGAQPYLTHDSVLQEDHPINDSVLSTNDAGDGGVLYFIHEDKIR